mmetsp:Transcript_14494/g.26192  ORF Transcript_14494/g.26192 Transcript_14494/m.26192 type:complete len:108 (+) Transcript_14494:396-719(+)
MIFHPCSCPTNVYLYSFRGVCLRTMKKRSRGNGFNLVKRPKKAKEARVWTELHKACRNGNEKRVNEFIRGTDGSLASQTLCGCTALHCAIKGDLSPTMLGFFLERGA